MPHGMPSRIWAGKKIPWLLPKKKMRWKEFKKMRPPMVAHRYPIRLVMGPAMKTPMKAPIGPLHWNADCHEASIIYFCPLSLYTPKSLANCGVAINCPIKKTQYDSIIYRSVRELIYLSWARAYNGA